MEVTSRQFADVTLIQVQGRISDYEAARNFEDSLSPFLDACVAGETKKILLDFGGVDFMTSAGLRVLMVVAKTCEKQKGEIVVAALQPIIKKIFEISRFDLIIKIFPNVKSALEAMSSSAAALYPGS